jgi:prolyl-tRNA synthetase
MPVVQPAELWQESGRWDKYGPELLRIKDRHDRAPSVIGPTHEEVITDLARNELRSYKQLPVNFYQIQTKFRDEIRPRFGVMRAREFLMKDAYSFHARRRVAGTGPMRDAPRPTRASSRAGPEFRAVRPTPARSAATKSQEFHVLADSGEDAIAVQRRRQLRRQRRAAPALAPPAPRPRARQAHASKVATPGRSTIADVAEFLGEPERTQCLKTLMVRAARRRWSRWRCAATTSSTRSRHRSCRASRPLRMAAPKRDRGRGAPVPASSVRWPEASRCHRRPQRRWRSPISCAAPTRPTRTSPASTGARPARAEVATCATWSTATRAPTARGASPIARGIEVGHIFQLGTKYSEALKASGARRGRQAGAP